MVVAAAAVVWHGNERGMQHAAAAEKRVGASIDNLQVLRHICDLADVAVAGHGRR